MVSLLKVMQFETGGEVGVGVGVGAEVALESGVSVGIFTRGVIDVGAPAADVEPQEASSIALMTARTIQK